MLWLMVLGYFVVGFVWALFLARRDDDGGDGNAHLYVVAFFLWPFFLVIAFFFAIGWLIQRVAMLGRG